MKNNNIFFQQSKRLQDAAYDVRNPKVREARLLIEKNIQEEIKTKRQPIKKLHSWHIGNPPYFDIKPPQELTQRLQEIALTYGYTNAQGLEEAIETIYQYHLKQGIIGLKKENIFITDGVSGGIQILMLACLNPGDEILLPSPNYPLWRLFTQLSDAIPVHYICDEQNNWYPDIDDIKRKISSRTKAILIINPNNPTGAVYPKEILKQIIKLAKEHRIIIFSDEIYCEMLYDQAKHIAIASLADDVLIFTLNGLSKNRLMPGIRSGWIAISGDTKNATDLINGINLLANARLCPNVFGQLAIPLVLPRDDYLKPLIKSGGRLYEQIKTASHLISKITELSCVPAQAAMYLYVKISEKIKIDNDEKFVLDLLKAERIQVVQGSGFDDKSVPRHFRIVCLAPVEELKEGISRLERFIKTYKQK